MSSMTTMEFSPSTVKTPRTNRMYIETNEDDLKNYTLGKKFPITVKHKSLEF